MRWTFEEFIRQLELDPSQNVLFVEGDHDLSFWRALVPISERRNTTVYKIGSIHVDAGGGERSRIFALADMLRGHRFSHRVRFFADADSDRILGRDETAQVILTDARDRESYLLSGDGLSALCETGFNKDPAFTAETARIAKLLLRPIGAVRVMSDRQDENLPFQRTLHPTDEPTRIRRYWQKGKNGKDYSLNQATMLSALLQNAGRSLDALESLQAAADEEDRTLAHLADDQIVHGKDLVAFVAWRFECAYHAAQACLNLALSQLKDSMLLRPNIQAAVAWIREEPLPA